VMSSQRMKKSSATATATCFQVRRTTIFTAFYARSADPRNNLARLSLLFRELRAFLTDVSASLCQGHDTLNYFFVHVSCDRALVPTAAKSCDYGTA
jgi:hypothetical protein